MKRLLYVLIFCVSFVAGVFGQRYYYTVVDRIAARFTNTNCIYPNDAYSFVRNEPITAEEVERWKREAQAEMSYSPLAIYSLGMYYSYLQHNNVEAVNCFERIQREYPSSQLVAGALLECGLARLTSGDNEAGLRAIELFTTKYPDSWRFPAAMMYIALYHRDNGDPERCCEILLRVMSDCPLSAQARISCEMAMELHRENGEHDEAARLALLMAGRHHSSIKSAQALCEWLTDKATYVGSEKALRELEAFIPLINGSEARRIVLKAAMETAMYGNCDKLELGFVKRILDEGICVTETPALLWRKYELELALKQNYDAQGTLTRLAAEHPDSPEGTRAGHEVNRIMSAGFGR